MVGKVLHIVSGDLWGGAEAQMGLQLPALQALGWQVEVLLFNDAVTARKYRERGLSVTVIAESAGFASLYSQARATVDEFKPQAIVTHGYKESILGFLLSRRRRCPWFVWFHGLSEGYRGLAELRSYCYQTAQKTLARLFAARLIAVSQDAARALGIANLKRTRVIYNVAPAKSDGAPLLDSMRRPAVVVVGRLVPIKRVDRAIAAFSACCQTQSAESRPRLYILGEGPLQSELEQLAKNSPVAEEIEFLGFKDNAADYIHAADCLLLTSDSEGVPTVLLEALVSMVPVVSTSVGGVPEVMQMFSEYPSALCERSVESVTAGLGKIFAGSERTAEQCAAWGAIYLRNFSPAIAAQRQSEELCQCLPQDPREKVKKTA
jgi:glycosyltransferase involved in cell wall biosynthesis